MTRPVGAVGISRVATWLAFALAWQILAVARHNPALFPPLHRVAAVSFPELALFGGALRPGFLPAVQVIAVAARLTLRRIVVGVALGAFLGLLGATAAYFAGANRRLSRVFLAAIRGVPLLALIPLFMFWFGDRELGMCLYIAFGVFVVISAVLYEAFCGVSRCYIDQARLLGANRFQVFAYVELPAIQPQFFSAIREALGLSWAFSLGAEYLTSKSGLGYLVTQSYLYSDMGKLFIMAAIYCLFAYTTYLVVAILSKLMGRWYLAGPTEGLP
jgi:ABC-type nitrate/sulfonate/bicarbonate transport system permease component